MKGFIAAVVGIVVFCTFQVSANKLCYSCLLNCDDKPGANSSTCTTTDYCVKVTTTVGETTTVTRTCTNPACTKVGCETASGIETCCCDTEKCNGASALSSAFVMVLAPLAASIFFTVY